MNSNSENSDSLHFYQKITQELLPQQWRNTIIADMCKPEDGEVYVRSSIAQLTDVNKWVNEFSINTSTKWNMRSSAPWRSSKLLCKKEFICHRSAFMKVKVDEQNRNKRGVSKNTKCMAKLIVTIKLTTRNTKFTDPFVKDGAPGIIRIFTRHNHPLESPSGLKCLPPMNSIREKFHEYFQMHMNVAGACRFHENKLMFENEYNTNNCESDEENQLSNGSEKCLDNAQYNPTKRTVRYWFDVWRKSQFGSKDGLDLEQKLRDTIAAYAADGVVVKQEDNPFVLVIITPLMARVHERPFSKDILFIDSTSTCNYSITLLLSASLCGAIPCGILITKNQTEASYSKGFKLFQDTMIALNGSSFYNQNYPNVVMTDNCTAEITSGEMVWPDSTFLLGIFHVQQYVLKWVQDTKHNIPKERQRELISSFQTILYCTDKNDAENAYIAAIETSHDLPQWQQYLADQYAMVEKWCLAYRVGITSHLTNNYAEISIRLFKENVLERVKAYNIIALLDFIKNTMDVFYKRKLREFYNSRECKCDIAYYNVLKENDYFSKETITKIDKNVYHVPSQSVPGITYAVDTGSGLCECQAGQRGRFCKHAAGIYKFFNVQFGGIPLTTIDNRREIAYIALGKNMPPYEYFLPPHKNELSDQEPCTDLITSLSMSSDDSENNLSLSLSSQSIAPDKNINVNHRGAVRTIQDVINRLADFDEKFGSSEKGLEKITARLLKLKSKDQWETFLHTAGSNIPSCRTVSTKIKVEPIVIQDVSE